MPDASEPAPTWQLRRAALGDPDAARLVAAVQAEYVARYGGPDQTPYDDEEFTPPEGGFWVGYLDQAPVATGAWRMRPDLTALGGRRVAEIKRMFVVSAARRRGLASRMLAALEADAAAQGADVVVLETGTAQPEAIALYERCGYEPVEPFGFYRDSPLTRCFGRRLTPAR